MNDETIADPSAEPPEWPEKVEWTEELDTNYEPEVE